MKAEIAHPAASAPIGTPSATPRRAANPWYVLGVLLLMQTFNYADRYLLAGLAQPIKTDFGLSDSFLGLLMGPAFAVLYTTLSVPLARHADRSSRRIVLATGCFVWSLFTILSGVASNGWWLAGARVGVGIGEAAFIGAAYSLLASSFPAHRRGKAFAILSLGIYIGQLGGYVAGPAIAAVADWRAAFILIGLLGVGLAALAFFTIAEPPHDKANGAEPPGASLWRTFATLWRQPTYRHMNLGMAFGTFSGMAFSMWAPSLFVRRFDIPLHEATALFGSAFMTFAIIGMLSFGWLADRLSRRDPRWPLRLSSFALMVATVATACTVISPDMRSVVLIAVPAGLLGGGWLIGIKASLVGILPENDRATGVALFTLLTTFIGTVFGPFFVGALSQSLGGSAAALQMAMLVAVAAGLPAALLLWRASTALPRTQSSNE